MDNFKITLKYLRGHQFHNNEEVEMAVCEWL
jgi:hypothetical protein